MRFAGIDVYVHATFPFLLLWIGIIYWNITQSWQGVLSGIGFVLTLFICVVLHEFGHALTARRFGYKTRNITLLPIGGVASFETLPEDPREEIIVALAGPAVNVVIALGLYLWIRLNDLPLNIEQLELEKGFSLGALMMVNITLVLFNLLPAFPMDGGRVFRALLSFNRPRYEATHLAAKTGQALAFGLGLLGLFFNPFMVIIALFIWMGAKSESNMEFLKAMLSGQTIEHTMLTDFSVLSPTSHLSRAVELTLAGSQKSFPIVENGKLIGVLSQSQLLKGLSEDGPAALVGRFAQGDIAQCQRFDSLEKVFDLFLKKPTQMVAVNEGSRLVGILDLENIMEFINFKKALELGSELTKT